MINLPFQHKISYRKVLQLLHQAINPDKYVEIGVAEGRSLELAACKSIAIDPSPRLKGEPGQNQTIYEITSDIFFRNYDLTDLLGGPFDLAFIDGMHLAEFALRDFINLEKHSHMASCIVIDDILPDDIEWTSRERKRKEWTGDVYKLIYILKKYRPDLDIEVFKVNLKGVAVITHLNKHSSELDNHYNKIIEDIDGGIYQVYNVKKLAEDFRPKPIDTLESWIQNKKHDLDRRKYLGLLKSSLINEIYADNDLRIIYLLECLQKRQKYTYEKLHSITDALSDEYQEIQEVKETGRLYNRDIKMAGFSHSMIGMKRMSSLISCLDVVRKNGISGELIECGVWRGGASIMMAAYNEMYKLNKKIFVADSFQGLPKSTYKQDLKMDLSSDKYPELAVSLDEVKKNFRIYNLLNENIIFLEGWFKDTLSKLDGELEISFLRLDGDLYESTMNILDSLYDKVVPGGIIFVDDFSIKNCREAVYDFLEKRNLKQPDIKKVDWTGIYWIKA